MPALLAATPQFTPGQLLSHVHKPPFGDKAANLGPRGLATGHELADSRRLEKPSSVDAVPQDGQASFMDSAKKLIHKALRAMTRDIGQMFKLVGVAPGHGMQLARTVIDPIREALDSGADFTAKIDVAAVQRQTLVSESGTSESLSLVARSLEIEVNHTTGEVSVELSSLSVQETTQTGFTVPAPSSASNLDELPADNVTPESGDGEPGIASIPAPVADDGESAIDPVSFEGFLTRIKVHAVERFLNDAGERITRFKLEAAVDLSLLQRSELRLEPANPDDPAQFLDLAV